MRFIKLVDGIKTESGYKFSDYSELRKPDNSSIADFMASTYMGELIQWHDNNKTAIETAIEELNRRCDHKDTGSESTFDFFVPSKNIRWEYDSENEVFYSVWVENGKTTGNAFKIESIKDVQEGQTYNEGIDVTIEK